MDDVITINGIAYVKMGVPVKKGTLKVMDYFYIDIPTFAEKMDLSEAKAREISRRKDLCDRGISITTNPGKKGGVRINWVKYVEYVETECPAVPEYMRVTTRNKRF